MSLLSASLSAVGVDVNIDAATNLSGAIADFNSQNLSASAIAGFASGGLSGAFGGLSSSTGAGISSTSSTGGTWESLQYADDLNAHHPKYKFLFKVGFYGFPGGTFYRFVHRCDKPRVRFNHQEVNYYNFRTRVLTSMIFEPLQITFLDEIGNTVNSFFTQYMANQSSQGAGRWGTAGDSSFSSTLPYQNSGASQGRSIVIEQIFAFGTASNTFTFTNPRIENLEFDELSMEESAGSLLTIQFTYDALTCATGVPSIYAWGNTDLLRGGGSSGAYNAGAVSLDESSVPTTSATGTSVGGGSGLSSLIANAGIDTFASARSGFNLANQVPGALQGVVPGLSSFNLANTFNQSSVVGSDGTVLSSQIQGTLTSIKSGDNLVFGGASGPDINTLSQSSSSFSSTTQSVTGGGSHTVFNSTSTAAFDGTTPYVDPDNPNPDFYGTVDPYGPP